MLAVLAGLCAQGAQAEGAEDGFLEVHSSGYSRFEFEGKEIVTFHTNGVEFSYMGYEGTTEELRYNHASKFVEARGDVELSWDGGSIRTNFMRVNGNGGYAKFGRIEGEATTLGVSYQAGFLELHFPEGKLNPTPEEITGQLGRVFAELPHELALKVNYLAYKGSEGCAWYLDDPVITGGPGELDLGEGRVLNIDGLEFKCDRIEGKLDNDLAIEEVVLQDISLTSAGLELTADEARMSGSFTSADFSEWSDLQAVLTPVDLSILLDGDVTRFQAAQARLESVGENAVNIEFFGGVVVSGADISLDTERVVLSVSDTGVAVSAPSSVAIGFDLAQLSGMTPVNLTRGAGE